MKHDTRMKMRQGARGNTRHKRGLFWEKVITYILISRGLDAVNLPPSNEYNCDILIGDIRIEVKSIKPRYPSKNGDYYYNQINRIMKPDFLVVIVVKETPDFFVVPGELCSYTMSVVYPKFRSKKYDWAPFHNAWHLIDEAVEARKNGG